MYLWKIYLQAPQGVQVDQGNLSVPSEANIKQGKWAKSKNTVYMIDNIHILSTCKKNKFSF